MPSQPRAVLHTFSKYVTHYDTFTNRYAVQSVVGSYADGVIAATAGNDSPVGEINGECRLCKYFRLLLKNREKYVIMDR
jgi:hypothetical protein